MTRALRVCCLLTLFPVLCLFSQEKTPPGWDVTAEHGAFKNVEFETEEGTWMTVSVSPDGKQIAFDLLGDIYLIPAAGGTARALTSGPAYDVQPRFSPDGKKIVFTSDRDGIDNLWIMNADGSNPVQVTKEQERQVNSPIWTPDGQFVIGRKHYRNTRSLGAGEMWLYHVTGGGGLQLTKRRNWQQDAGEPAISPDGRYLYYSEDVTPSGYFEYNKDPYGIIYAIQRFDRVTGKTEQLIAAPGGSARPEVSPDGKTIAFVRRVRLTTVLYLFDLESGKETPIYDQLSMDQQEAWAIFGVYPGFSWTPDGQSIIIWAKGKIRKIDVASGKVSEVPFKAAVRQRVTDALRFAQDVSPDSFDVKMLRWVAVSPDGKNVAYNVLGKLWLRPLPDGTPRRLTVGDEGFEMYPSFSPDGAWIVYTTWSDKESGAVRKVKTNGSGGRALTSRKGTYLEPSFSPDGKQIVYRRGGGDDLRGRLYSREQGIYVVGADGGASEIVTEEGSKPAFTDGGDRIYLFSREGEKAALISVGMKGEQRRVHLVSDNATEIVPSPDGRWVGIVERYQVYCAVLPRTGQPVAIGPGTSDYPIKKLTRDAGTFLGWTGDSRRLFWALGPRLFSRDVRETFAFAGDGKDSAQDGPDTVGMNIGFRATTDVPSGVIALVGATAITMKGDEVIKDATIVIDRNRIVAVGSAATVRVPSGAKVVKVNGKYIIPGIIDVHAHGNFEDLPVQTNWRYYANLAFGVTTMHDPSANTESVFSNSEMIRAGLAVGPRLFSTGTILYGAEGEYKATVNNLDDAMGHLRRLNAVGAFTVKSYNQPRRDQRQEIVEAARELRMMVVPEGGSTFFWNMTHVLDGHTGVEHNLPIAPLYNDVIRLTAASGTGITPTLIVSYGGLSGEYYWYQHSNVWEHPLLMKYTPRAIVDSRSRRRMMADESDYSFVEVSRSMRALVDAGGKVQLGAHGQLQGLGAHWELWMLEQGGMTPMQALRCATLYGAQYIGLDKDLGSLEQGKLADLAVLDKNPLEDIRNSDSVRLVMVNGRLYDSWSGDEIGVRERKRGQFYWEQ